MRFPKLTAALCGVLALFVLGAGKKISDYTETLELGDAWIYEIAVPGVTNYKVTFGTMATNIIARVEGEFIPSGSSVALPLSSVQFNSNGVMQGSALMTFTNGLLTVVNTTKSSNIWDKSNVKYWGIVNDGVTDVSDLIQARLNAGGGKLVFPSGPNFYRITKTLTITNNGTVLEGETTGNNANFVSWLKWDAAFAGTCIDIKHPTDGGGINIYAVTLRDLKITAQNSANNGVRITRGYETLIERCRIDGVNGTGVGVQILAGTGDDYTTFTTLKNNFITGWASCIRTDGVRTTANRFFENSLLNATGPIVDNIFDGVLAFNNIEGGAIGVTIGGGCSILGNRIEAISGRDIIVSNNVNCSILGNNSTKTTEDVLWVGNPNRSAYLSSAYVATNELHGTVRLWADDNQLNAINFYNENIGQSPMGQLRLYSDQANTNLFGQAISVREVNLAASSGNLNLGTIGSGNVNILGPGNVGVGTNAPGYKLEVNGTARITGAVMLNNGSPTAGQVPTFRSDGTIYPSNVVAGASTQMVAAAIGTLTITNALSVGTLNVNNVNLTNALGSNVVRLGVNDLTNSAAQNPINGNVLAWHSGMQKWTNTIVAAADVISNVTASTTANLLFDFSMANVFKVKLLTNFSYTFTNTAYLQKKAYVYFQQDDIGVRLLNTYTVAGGILQTNANMQPTTNGNALDVMEVMPGFLTTNLVAWWPQNFQPRVPYPGSSVATFIDNFDRTTADPMTTTASGGGTWTSGQGLFGDCQIDSNLLRGSTGTENAARVLTPDFADNQSASATVVAAGSSLFFGVGVRSQSTTDGSGYFASPQSDTSIMIQKVADNGASFVYTDLTPAFTVTTLAPGDIVTLGVVGATFTLYINAVSQGTRTDATYSSGQPWMYFYNTPGLVTTFTATDL